MSIPGFEELNKMSTEDLRALNRTLVDILKHRATLIAQTLNYGDKVTFVGRHGIRHTGVVTGINRKTVAVRVGSAPWRVSPTLLKKVA